MTGGSILATDEPAGADAADAGMDTGVYADDSRCASRVARRMKSAGMIARHEVNKATARKAIHTGMSPYRYIVTVSQMTPKNSQALQYNQVHNMTRCTVAVCARIQKRPDKHSN